MGRGVAQGLCIEILQHPPHARSFYPRCTELITLRPPGPSAGARGGGLGDGDTHYYAAVFAEAGGGVR